MPVIKFSSPSVFLFAALSGQPLSAALQAAAGCQRAERELAAAGENGVDLPAAAAQPPAAFALPPLPADHGLPAHQEQGARGAAEAGPGAAGGTGCQILRSRRRKSRWSSRRWRTLR